MNNQLIPYPRAMFQLIFKFPLMLHHLGLGWVVSFAPILILTTRGRKSGEYRYTPLEYRRHGSKLYVLSAWGEQADWYQNLQTYPEGTVKLGNRTYPIASSLVTDKSEAQRALYMFRRTAPVVYDSMLKYMSSVDNMNLKTLADVADEFTLVRLEICEGSAHMPSVRADRVWVIPALLGTAVVISAILEVLARLRDNDHQET